MACPQKTGPVNNYYYSCIPPLLSKQVNEKKARRPKTGRKTCLLFLKVFKIFQKKFRSRQTKIAHDPSPCQTVLWISYWISTGSFVQNRPACAQTKNCPTTFPARYNAFKTGCHRRKPLTLLINTDLSTELSSFTTTTIFVYIPLYKTVNRERRWETAKVS